MDYRYYRGDGFKIPPKYKHLLHRLRQVGVALAIIGVSIPFLIVIKLLRSTYITNFLAIAFIILGPILYLIGMVFDNYIDRTK